MERNCCWCGIGMACLLKSKQLFYRSQLFASCSNELLWLPAVAYPKRASGARAYATRATVVGLACPRTRTALCAELFAILCFNMSIPAFPHEQNWKFFFARFSARLFWSPHPCGVMLPLPKWQPVCRPRSKGRFGNVVTEDSALCVLANCVRIDYSAF